LTNQPDKKGIGVLAFLDSYKRHTISEKSGCERTRPRKICTGEWGCRKKKTKNVKGRRGGEKAGTVFSKLR